MHFDLSSFPSSFTIDLWNEQQVFKVVAFRGWRSNAQSQQDNKVDQLCPSKGKYISTIRGFPVVALAFYPFD